MFLKTWNRTVVFARRKVTANESVVETFRESLQEFLECEHLSLGQVYNYDKTGLSYRIVPHKTLAAKSEKSASAMKKEKEHVTVMCCSNATGMHKLPLLVIVKSQNSRFFKHLNKIFFTSPLLSSVRARISISLQWFHHQFIPAVTKRVIFRSEHADNAPSHPDA